MAESNFFGGLTGGLLIGLAAALLLLFNGRIAGISGILGGLIDANPISERLWRGAFIIGLVCGAAVYSWIHGGLPLQLQVRSSGLLLAGLLVGFGTRLGSGCTSGHGVCGLARSSPRSLVATATFIACGMLTVYLTRHVF
ncbi:MAG TPA: YeeE/YedE thiosulfate transporter family protein [Candidatus Limnocylindria bacterium]|nr:YeeE/YedE thiosulfate transporter family protein [Candidatus Limnocylindria bacterium]